MMCSSAGREFYDAGPEKEKPGAQPRCDVHVAGCFRDRAQTGAYHCGRRTLHNVDQITLRLSDVNVLHDGAMVNCSSSAVCHECSDSSHHDLVVA